MAEKLGVSTNYIGMLESGQKAGPTLVKLFDMVEREWAKPVDDALGGSSPRELIRSTMRKRALTYGDLAKLTKYKADVLQAVIEGQGQASEKMIEAIAGALKLDKETLMAGTEQLVVRDGVFGTYGAKPNIDVEPGIGTPRYLPLLSMAQAGTMTDTNFTDGGYTHEGVLAFGPRDSRAFGVTVHGDSMMPDIKPGDVAIVYPQSNPMQGDVVVCRLKEEAGGDVMIKLFSMRDRGQRVVLTSHNPAYPPLEYERKDFTWIYPVANVLKTLRK